MHYPVKTAHYTATKNRKFVTIVDAGQPYSTGVAHEVAGKSEARVIARKYQAQPWNF